VPFGSKSSDAEHIFFAINLLGAGGRGPEVDVGRKSDTAYNGNRERSKSDALIIKKN
jgi:hypothetical protein